MADVVIKNRYNEKDVRSWIPEACDPLIKIWAPELKETRSHWQVGTSPVTRVKICALSEKAIIDTSKATTITGTASENYEKIKTLGMTQINVCDNFYKIEVHVTRSENVAPFVVDGIFGLDFIKSNGWVLDRETQRFYRPHRSGFSLLPPDHYFLNYTKALREKMILFNLSKEKNERASVSKRRLLQARPYLPPEVNGDSRSQVVDVLHEYSDCLFLPGDKIPPTNLLKYPIKLKPEVTFAFRQPQHSPEDWNEIERIVTDLLRQDILRVSTSSYNSPMGLLAKKPDARGKISFRLSGHYSELNNRSESKVYPIPEIYDAVDRLHGSKYFSVLDLVSGSYHIPIEPQDCCKTAFTTTSGKYEFRRVPSNLKNGGPYMQLLMDKVLEGIKKDVFVCHDDMLIHAPTIEEHEVRIRKVFDRLRAHGLKLQPGKCQLFKSQVLYLGFLITDEGIRPDPAKIKKLRLPQRPNSSEALRSWLGLLSTHKRFLRGYAGRAQPMFDMVKKDYSHWTVDALQNYQIFQMMLTEDLLLRYPDWNRSFTIQIGFDDYGIYAGLMQKIPGEKQAKAIAWDSRTYKSNESQFHNEAREKLASRWGLETFRRYIQNAESLDELTRNLSIKS